ncbi:MAG TPA: [FeFe] hydrogenase H-cluster radical SAM maturase HydE [Gemmataceae bacterium]|nr:[FeFe] hydrogenase H-cluster radical SAM maturase HydE [Gemmataceae bacterium]
MNRGEILAWLREDDKTRLQSLWGRADALRQEQAGDAVHLRGLVEFSNHCARRCMYCGLRAGNRKLPRYRLTAEQVLECARQAAGLGYGTVVLQSGEDPGLDVAWMAGLIGRIKSETGLAVTLSLGERVPGELAEWRRAGADRYLLRFETSNRALFRRIHPPTPGQACDRIAQLHELRRLGYEVGSGVMIGIPGQSYDDLADDVVLFRELDLDMIGVGPYLPHPATPLGRYAGRFRLPAGEQVPATELMTYKVVALARLVCPRANIPATTALATLNPFNGRELGLRRGANVIMPNVTPRDVRAAYEIYPAKACIRESASQCQLCVQRRILAIGRAPGIGPGPAANFRGRQPLPQAP